MLILEARGGRKQDIPKSWLQYITDYLKREDGLYNVAFREPNTVTAEEIKGWQEKGGGK